MNRWEVGLVKKYHLLFVILVLSVSGCRTPEKASEPIRFIPDISASTVAQASELNHQSKHVQAEESMRALLRSHPTNSWYRAAQYQLGISLEGQEKYRDALFEYRQLGEQSSQVPELAALALFRSSFCWEALGEEFHVVASLRDAWRKRSHLPPEVSEAELPARLAGAYSRVGQSAEADRYFKLAEDGLVRIQARAGGQVPDWLGRTLYSMGRLSLESLSWEEFGTMIKPIPRAQAYLARAVVLQQAPYSERARAEVEKIYQKILIVLTGSSKVNEMSNLSEQREQQELLWSHTAQIFELVRQLRSHLVLAQKSPDELHAFLDDVEAKLAVILSERPVGEGLTPEAKTRWLKRKWRTINPEPLPNEEGIN